MIRGIVNKPSDRKNHVPDKWFYPNHPSSLSINIKKYYNTYDRKYYWNVENNFHTFIMSMYLFVSPSDASLWITPSLFSFDETSSESSDVASIGFSGCEVAS